MKTIVKMVHGSHLYGINTPESDIDYKGIVLPSRRQILLQEANFHINKSTGTDKSKNSSNDVDDEVYSLHRFIDMACSGEMIAVDMLHCSAPVFQSPLWSEIRSIRSKFYTSQMKGYLGFLKKQVARYCTRGKKLIALEASAAFIKSLDHPDTKLSRYIIALGKLAKMYPDYIEIKNGFWKGDKWISTCVLDVSGSKFDLTCKIGYVVSQLERLIDSFGNRARAAKENDGIDWKAVVHSVRAGQQLLEIYQTGDLQFPLKERELLLKIKRGELDFTSEVAPIMESIVDEVDAATSVSSYPPKVNRDEINDWLLDVYRRFAL